MPAKQPPYYPGQKRILTALGERLRLARLRRKLTIDVTCQRAGISRMTLFRAEAGSPAIALGTLLRILAVLGLEGDIEALARDDKVGRLLQDQALPVRRRRRGPGARARTAPPKERTP
jgi:transcriptional regulator with XRE-family HTH domain